LLSPQSNLSLPVKVFETYFAHSIILYHDQLSSHSEVRFTLMDLPRQRPAPEPVAAVSASPDALPTYVRKASANTLVDAQDHPFSFYVNTAKMFNLGANPKVKGSGILVLNGLRAFTVVGLVSMMASSWAMIVLAGLAGRFNFWDTMAHIFVFLFAVFLTISEVNIFTGYFEANWPIFSVSHSLAWLGVFLVGLAMQVLTNLEKDKYSKENLGLPIYRLVLASGILNIVSGVFNLVASIIFRDGAQNITARRIRRDGSLASPDEAYGGYGSYSKHSASIHEEKDGGMSRARRFTQMMNPRNLQQQVSTPP
jgi:hypothetical protein